MSFATALLVFSAIFGIPLFLYVSKDMEKDRRRALAQKAHEDKLREHDKMAAELCKKVICNEQIREMKSFDAARKHGFKTISDLEYDRFVSTLS